MSNITPEFLSMIKLPDEKGVALNYLMVMPVLTHDDNAQYPFPTGFAAVSSALKASGRTVHTLNLNYKLDPLRLLKHTITAKKIDVVLTGGVGLLFEEIKAIIDEAKNVKPDIVAIVGGSIITTDPETAMAALENADYGVIGEAEITVNAVAYALETKNDAADVAGVICWRNSEWVVRKDFPIVTDLDVLPFPDYEGFEYGILLEKPISLIKIIFPQTKLESSYIAFLPTSRSCPYNCTFCFHSPNERYRQMSMDMIFKMLDWLISLYPVDYIYPTTEVSFTDPKTAIEFSRRIEPYKLKWRMNTRANLITKEMCEALKESGCEYLSFGTESYDNRVLKSMRKNITSDDLDRVIGIVEEMGMPINSNLIFGDPEETRESFEKTIDWWRKVHKNGVITLNLVRAYSGSQIYEDACAKGIIKDRVQFLKDGMPPVNISQMTDDEYYMLPYYFYLLTLRNKLEEAELELQNDFTLDIIGKCPHCQKTVCFYNYGFVVNLAPRRCPKCREDIIVNPIEYFDSTVLKKGMESLWKEGDVAVWAVTPQNFHFLLEAMPVIKDDKVRFINKDHLIIPDSERIVKTLAGKEVFTPDIIKKWGGGGRNSRRSQQPQGV
jgi:radical SAM superfamily enzyme YgiQ (UPF0313 family)